MKKVWLRREDKLGERRVPVTPVEVASLVAAGVQVTVESSLDRCYSDAEYEAAGAHLTELRWQDAPVDSVIIALKELDESLAPIAHTQIHFSHTFKGQDSAKAVLERYALGGGKLYDLEFLHDSEGRRVAAFGYWAGFVGAALGLLGYAHFSDPTESASKASIEPAKEANSFPPLAVYSSKAALIAAVDAALASASALGEPPRVLVMGALGRCGSGARDLLVSLETTVHVSAWDMPEFAAAEKPIPEILTHDLFINCVYLREPIAPMIDEELLAKNTRLRIISDVSCDPTSEGNPVRVYEAITSIEKPFVRARDGGGRPVYVQAIDHLPTLLPRESSQEYAAALFPSLFNFLISESESGTWREARLSFEAACAGYGLFNH